MVSALYDIGVLEIMRESASISQTFGIVPLKLQRRPIPSGECTMKTKKENIPTLMGSSTNLEWNYTASLELKECCSCVGKHKWNAIPKTLRERRIFLSVNRALSDRRLFQPASARHLRVKRE